MSIYVSLYPVDAWTIVENDSLTLDTRSEKREYKDFGPCGYPGFGWRVTPLRKFCTYCGCCEHTLYRECQGVTVARIAATPVLGVQ